MIIYIDLVIIATILTDASILKTIAILFNEKLNYRLFIGLALSVFLVFLFLLPLKEMFVLRYFVGIVICFVVFNKKPFLIFLIKVVMYYLMNITLIGILAIFNIKSFLMVIIALFLVVLTKFLESYKETLNPKQLREVKVKKQKYCGLLDSGNMAYYKGRAIAFINKKYQTNDFTLIGVTTIKAIKEEKVIVYNGPPIEYNKKTFTVYYVFINDLDYDIILPSECI